MESWREAAILRKKVRKDLLSNPAHGSNRIFEAISLPGLR
jgi:hypothetical protein